MIGVQQNIASYSDFYNSCFIQPIKQKLFTFNLNINENKKKKCIKSEKIIKADKLDQERWTPVMSYKKLYAQPKFIMSLQRKKARIISGIRDRQIQENIKKSCGMIGSKVKNINYKNHLNKSVASYESNMQSFVQQSDKKVAKLDLKAKKNPYMNFSLMYISQRKKCETDLKTKMSTNVCRSSSTRQKGSDNPYIHMMISQSTHRKQFSRPQTSCVVIQKSKRNQRPKSQIY